MVCIAEIKIKGEEKIIANDVILCGIHPDYPMECPVYFFRFSDGTQLEIPISSIAWMKFSKDRYEKAEGEE